MTVLFTMKKHLYLLLLLLFIGALPIKAQLLLNEASSRNATLYSEGNQDYDDFIEVINTSLSPTNLNNYYLTDDKTIPQKWQFFSQILPGNGITMVIADGVSSFAWYNNYQHCNFKIDVDGETIYLVNAASQFIDSLIIPKLDINQSVGKAINQTTGQVYFDKMTPNAANNTSSYSIKANTPIVLPVGAFYTNSVTVNCSCPVGQTIHYSLNGQTPDSNSLTTTGPITLTQTTALKVRCMSSAFLPGNCKTETYFINETSNLPIVSLSSDSVNLWGYTTGIFVAGPDSAIYNGSNFLKGWRRPAKIEFYENGIKQFGKDAAILVDGGSSIVYPKHTLRVNFSHSTLGNSKLSKVMFPNAKPNVTTFKTFKLRNGGNVYGIPYTNGGGGILFHDALVHSMARNLHVAYAAYRPTHLFINGQYWGLYELRERQDDYFYASNFATNEDSLRLYDRDGWAVDTYLRFDSVLNELVSIPNKSSASFFNFVTTEFDKENLFDYFGMELFFRNTDWLTSSYSSNLKMWRDLSSTGDKRYRFTLHDFDYSFCNATYPIDALDNLLNTGTASAVVTKVFRNAIQHPIIKKEFINRYADLMNYYFHADSIQQRYDMYNAEISTNDINRECSQWPTNALSRWQTVFTQLRNCVIERQVSAFREVDSLFNNQAGFSNITFETYPSNAGQITVNTLTPSLPWSGRYFKGNELPVSATANPGYMFSHWETNATLSDTTQSQVDTFFTANQIQMKAIFVPQIPLAENSLDLHITHHQCRTHIEWSLADETNLDHYVLDIKKDDQPFEALYSVNCKHEPNATYSYNYENSENSNLLFQVRIIDADGKTQYSMPSYVHNSCFAHDIAIFPNPVTDYLTIQFPSFHNNSPITVQLKNNIGQVLFTQTCTAKTPLLEIPFKSLPPSLYNLSIQQDDQLTVRKIIKQ